MAGTGRVEGNSEVGHDFLEFPSTVVMLDNKAMCQLVMKPWKPSRFNLAYWHKLYRLMDKIQVMSPWEAGLM